MRYCAEAAARLTTSSGGWLEYAVTEGLACPECPSIIMPLGQLLILSSHVQAQPAPCFTIEGGRSFALVQLLGHNLCR
ncbi:hypothetical protein ABIF66_008618 [Bradyrhizobium japonicum]|jgi:hypothetical protein